MMKNQVDSPAELCNVVRLEMDSYTVCGVLKTAEAA